MYTSSFIPEPKAAPLGTDTEHFIIRMLSAKDVKEDYQAVMSSLNHLMGI